MRILLFLLSSLWSSPNVHPEWMFIPFLQGYGLSRLLNIVRPALIVREYMCKSWVVRELGKKMHFGIVYGVCSHYRHMLGKVADVLCARLVAVDVVIHTFI